MADSLNRKAIPWKELKMANGIPNWDEWSGLTKEQRDYSLFKILGSMDNRLGGVESACLLKTAKLISRHDSCVDKFCSLHAEIDAVKTDFDDSKKKIKYIATGFGLAGAGGALSFKEIWAKIEGWF